MPSARAVTDPQDPALKAFGHIQNAVYPEPDALIPPSMFGQMLGWSTPERQNFIVVAEDGDGTVLGGTLFHLFTPLGTAFSSFMGVAHFAQGRGVSRRLHRERWHTLERALGRAPEGLFIDVVNPARLTPEELEGEARVGSSPTRRREVFGHLGFLQLEVQYVQPSSPPVTNMDLLYFHPERSAVSGPPSADDGPSIPVRLVTDTLQAYWEPWLGEKRARTAAAELAARAGGERVRLIAPS